MTSLQSMVPSNQAIAGALDAVADLLGAQHANLHRIRHWQNAARLVRECPHPVAELVREGAGVPGVSGPLGSAIRELVDTGRLRTLERLQGEVNPEQVLRTVPGLGPDLAHVIHERLGIVTLEDLEEAAHDGRLEALPGFGPRRTLAVRETLAGMLGRSGRSRSRTRHAPASVPGVDVLLSVDGEYRQRAAAGELPTIAPRRFNTRREKWLPILHTERDGLSFTALFSNTARAHELAKTHDWVVLYWNSDHDHAGAEGQCTVVTETRGPLSGRRVVRGRETECREWYLPPPAASP